MTVTRPLSSCVLTKLARAAIAAFNHSSSPVRPGAISSTKNCSSTKLPASTENWDTETFDAARLTMVAFFWLIRKRGVEGD